MIQGQGDSGFGAQMKGSQGPQDKIPCVVAGWKEEGVCVEVSDAILLARRDGGGEGPRCVSL